MDTEFQKTPATTPSTPAPAQENTGFQDSATGNTAKTRSRRTLQERWESYEKREEALKKEKARLTKESRKERNGQLIAWGIFVEAYYKCCEANERNEFREAFKEHLKGREQVRALKGCNRLDNEVPAEKEEKERETETPHGVGERIKNFLQQNNQVAWIDITLTKSISTTMR